MSFDKEFVKHMKSFSSQLAQIVDLFIFWASSDQWISGFILECRLYFFVNVFP
jgi:hypothetical protein